MFYTSLTLGQVYKGMTKIGEGAAGEVYGATHTKSGQKVAVKKMEINNENIKLLATEIGIMKTSKHPNIVEYLYSHSFRILSSFVLHSFFFLPKLRYVESYIVDDREMACLSAAQLGLFCS